MGNRVCRSSKSSESKLHWSRVCGFLITAAAVAFLCKSLPAQNDGGGAIAASSQSVSAQASGESTNGEASSQSFNGGVTASSSQNGNAQTSGSSNGQGTAQSSGAPASSAQGGNAQGATQGNNVQPTAQANGSQATRPQAATAEKSAVTPAGGAQVTTQSGAYGNMPALADLNVQVPTSGGEVTRFGSEIFLFGTGNANSLPMDLPVGPDYLLGVGDSLVVNMWGGQSNRLEVTIDRQGQITLPEAGPIMIAGMNIGEAQIAVQKTLSTQFQGEHVEISLGRLRTIRVYVLGDVQRPGAYDISSLSTPLSALFAAGGPTAIGSLRILKQYRRDKLVREMDLYQLLLKGIRSDTDRLLPGDVLFVPPAGPQVSLEGMVHHPAIYEMTTEKTLSQVLNLAGGFTATASLKQIIVSRVIAHERHTMLDVPLSGDPAEVTRQLEGFQVQGGDQVLITSILPINKNAVYLQGHVYRPGRYPYKDGMTINDLVHSFQDVLPEPSDHAELVRLMPPDYHPQVTIFSLREAMIGNDSFHLQPFDSIRIYGRYDVDAPEVSIAGDVLRPGSYPMSQGMTVGDLLRMAGGFTRPAYRDEADLSSYEIQNGQKVLDKQVIVAMEKALDGDKSADVVLKPLDVLNIRRIAGWQDIGASVSISGEVEHAGTYGIVDGERLSSVIKRAGGFREDAYPAAAVLERVQVRELAEQARQQMLLRIEDTPVDLRPGTMSEQAATAMQQALQEQRQEAITALRNQSASGRLVISISAEISHWENSPADIELRAGDTLYIPKRPNFVTVTGQVYNPIAINYSPGKGLNWYLRKAGNSTTFGDKKHIYVLRADGSVVPRESEGGSLWMVSSFMNLRMRPGDTIFVPEKIIGGSPVWQDILGVAQIMTAAALPLAISGTL